VRHSKDRSPSIFRLGLLVVLAVTSLSAQQPPAQQPASQAPSQAPQPKPSPEDQPPRFRTDANYVRVDVYPTKDGKTVEDLRAEDFELLENGVKQQVQAFERVVISPAGPQSMRVEANTVRGGEQMASNPRNRVFVIFLDIPHVDIASGHHINQPLVRLIDRMLGPDDLIAVMTTEMTASQITFGRKTEVIADMLRDKWYWGMRDSVLDMDERERDYIACFPPGEADRAAGRLRPEVVTKMIARRRERMVLDSLRDLVRYLGSVREERKAILTVTQGWLLFRPDSSMTTLRVMDRAGNTEPIPGNEPIGVDPRGKLRVGGESARESVPASQTICDKDRMYLASLDNDEYFRYILDVANRNNASFYPIDPRGLAAFDAPMGPEAPPTIPVDLAMLNQRGEILRTLAENTDGVAVVNTNDLDRGLQRIADDFTSYYLLGYYSTNTKLDGQFRRITVRVRRPGVDVRARRGYRAATAEEVNASRAAAAAPIPEATKTATAALARLGGIRPEQRFVIHAAPFRPSPSAPVSTVWVAGELQGPPEEFGTGASASIEITGGSGVAESTATLKAGERAFLVKIPVQAGTTGAFDIRVRMTPAAGGTPLQDVAKLDLDPALQQPLLFRRGLSTGNRLQPAAGFQFSRTDRLHLELPISTATPGTGRFLDRNAQPLQIPVQVGDKTDAEGQRWLTADATLAALGAGDYVLEVTLNAEGTERRVLTGIRVTR
jgi:VWFA-related protein